MPSDQKATIIAWLESVSPRRHRVCDDSERRAKRARHCMSTGENDAVGTPVHAVLPSSPPATAMSTKRDASVMDRVPALPRDPSPKKRRSASPTKRANLALLEKPVHIRAIAASTINAMPPDTDELLSRIRTARLGDGLIPHEVRQRLETIEGDLAIRPSSFRTHDTPDAAAAFNLLLDIRQEAEAATEQEYDESSWNHCVHTPLLRSVFTTKPLNVALEGQANRLSESQARLVPVMYATIMRDYVPGPSYGPSITNRMQATSISSSASDTGSYAGSTVTEINVGNTKKVDYALCLEVSSATALHKGIQDITNGQARDVLPHVNQTLYVPLGSSPIAVSIETKVITTAQDPILQLGIWTAAWHKRMEAHRDYLRVNGRHEVRIPSTLLLEVENHKWSLYFVCDSVSEILLYGPLSVGSTATLMDLYTLTATLEAVRDWITGPFRVGMETFFKCNS